MKNLLIIFLGSMLFVGICLAGAEAGDQDKIYIYYLFALLVFLGVGLFVASDFWKGD